MKKNGIFSWSLLLEVMNRRKFVSKSALVTSGIMAAGRGYGFTISSFYEREVIKDRGLYDLFRDPDIHYRPFVRWWWNGDKVEADDHHTCKTVCQILLYPPGRQAHRIYLNQPAAGLP